MATAGKITKIQPHFTPNTVPDALVLANELDEQYEKLRAQYNTLVGTMPDSVIKPLMNALYQFRLMRKNLVKTNESLMKLEREQQRKLHLAAPDIELPRFSFRVLATSGTVLKDDTTEERALAAVYEYGPTNTHLYRRPVTSNLEEDWEKVEMIPLGPTK